MTALLVYLLAVVAGGVGLSWLGALLDQLGPD